MTISEKVIIYDFPGKYPNYRVQKCIPECKYTRILSLYSEVDQEKQWNVSSQYLFVVKNTPGNSFREYLRNSIREKLEILYCVWNTIVFEKINKCDLMYNTYRAEDTLKDSKIRQFSAPYPVKVTIGYCRYHQCTSSSKISVELRYHTWLLVKM